MTENLLVLGDGPELQADLVKHEIKAQYIDLRKGYESNGIMDIYEVVAPELCGVVRQEILSINPDKIVVVGRSKDYLWDATIVAYAIESLKDWAYTDEK